MTIINTYGGTAISGSVESGGDFIGRDKITVNIYNPSHPLEVPPPPAPYQPSMLNNFVGRDTELAEYQNTIQETGFAAIVGISGSGKTSLASALAHRLAASDKLFWFSCFESEDVYSFIWSIAGFLATRGKSRLWEILNTSRVTSSTSIPITVLYEHIFELLKGEDLVICLDDFHHLVVDIQSKQLLNRLITSAQLREFKLIITARENLFIPPFSSIKHLGGLSIQNTKQLLQVHKLELNDSLINKLHLYTNGMPTLLLLSLEALRRTHQPEMVIGHLSDTSDITTYLIHNVDVDLDKAQRMLLEGFAVLMGLPATPEALTYILNQDDIPKTIKDLEHRFLVSSNKLGSSLEYTVPTFVQQFYYELLGRREKSTLLRRAGEFYENREQNEFRAAFYFQHAGDYEHVIELVFNRFLRIISRAGAESLYNLLGELRAEELKPLLLAKLNVAKAQVSISLWRREEAVNNLQQALSIVESQVDSAEKRSLGARIYLELGKVLENENPQAALDNFQRGLDELRDVDGVLAFDLLTKLENLHRNMGDQVAAKEISRKIDLVRNMQRVKNAQIFLSYAREDFEKAHKIYKELKKLGFKPWMDKQDILPGEKWEVTIQKSIRNSQIVLILLSSLSVNKRGYLQKEIRMTLSEAEKMLDRDIFVIPAKLEECEMPDNLSQYQWIELFEENSLQRLIDGINEGMSRRED